MNLTKSRIMGAFLAAGMLSAWTAGAQAADTWGGVYIGVHGGYATGAWDGRLATQGATSSDLWLRPGRSLDADAWLGGGQAGFNVERGALVFGLEADATFADMSDGRAFVTDGPLVTDEAYTWDIDADVRAFGTVRVRVGYAVTPAVLVYGTGGLAWARTSADIVTSHTWVPDPSKSLGVTARGSVDETHVGWAAGIGSEVRLATRWSVRGEWLHVDLGTAGYRFKGPNAYASDSFKSELTFDVFRLGLNYRLGE